jgi:hypothetical protein
VPRSRRRGHHLVERAVDSDRAAGVGQRPRWTGDTGRVVGHLRHQAQSDKATEALIEAGVVDGDTGKAGYDIGEFLQSRGPELLRPPRQQGAHQRRLGQPQEAPDLERRGQADVFTAVRRQRPELVADRRQRAVGRVAHRRQRAERAAVPGRRGVAPSSGLGQRHVTGLGHLRGGGTRRVTQSGRVGVLDLHVGGAVGIDAVHRAVLGAEQPDVECLGQRPEVAVVGGGKTPVCEDREPVDRLEEEAGERRGERAGHVAAYRGRGIDIGRPGCRGAGAHARPLGDGAQRRRGRFGDGQREVDRRLGLGVR